MSARQTGMSWEVEWLRTKVWPTTRRQGVSALVAFKHNRGVGEVSCSWRLRRKQLQTVTCKQFCCFCCFLFSFFYFFCIDPSSFRMEAGQGENLKGNKLSKLQRCTYSCCCKTCTPINLFVTNLEAIVFTDFCFRSNTGILISQSNPCVVHWTERGTWSVENFEQPWTVNHQIVCTYYILQNLAIFGH